MMPQPLVLIPGTLCDARVFAPVIGLIGADAACMALGTGGQDSIGDMAEAVLAQAPPRFALAGFSLGGMVALEIVARAPERVSGLALLCTKATPTPPAQKLERLTWLKAARREGLAALVTLALLRWLHPSNVNDAAVGGTVIDMAVSEGVAVLERQTRANNGRPDSRPRLAHIATPTLVLFGEADQLCTPQDSRDMAQAIPGAVLVEVAGAGHFALLEQPAAVASALRDWLVRVAAAPESPTRLRNDLRLSSFQH